MKEPVMIYATANAHPYIPIRNLSTTHKHYRTYTDLCSTTEDTLETCCNLSTATDLQHNVPAEPPAVLARPLHIPFDHTTIL
jgi:hypothetical protein